MKRRLRMIGGGPDAFIGAVHRSAARLTDLYDLCCGAFSSVGEKSIAMGMELGLPVDRVYSSLQIMREKDKLLLAESRVEVIAIVTPNHLHFQPAKLALEGGFHVIVEKPITFSISEALELKRLIERTQKRLLLIHNYTGYPMIKEARNQILSGKLGKVWKVYVEYIQGWLSTEIESKQAEWRTDPARSGIAGAVGDIGNHSFNLAEYVSGLSVKSLCANINTVVPNRKLDDDAAVLLEFEQDATGVLMVSQIATGEENNIKIRVFCEKGDLQWLNADANSLLINWSNAPSQIYRTGANYVSPVATKNSFLPAGHPEGYLEASANLYRNFAESIIAESVGEVPDFLAYPGIEEGIRGMAFIKTVITSGKSEKKMVGFNF